MADTRPLARLHANLLGGLRIVGRRACLKGQDGGEYTPEQRKQKTLPARSDSGALGWGDRHQAHLPANLPLW